jgi:hypothetical protein
MEHAMNNEEGREWLKSHLKMGPVYVTFTKKDGTERKMKCTLKEGVVVPHEKTTERVKEENVETLAVWDMEKSAWRSFRLDTIKTIEFGIE